MPSFDDSALRTRTDAFSLYREPRFVYVRLHGAVDDSTYEAWCRAVDDNIAVEGLPRYVCVDAEEARSAATLAGRIKAANWARGFKGKMEGGAVFLSRDQQQLLFVARSILRVVASERIRVLNDPDELRALLQSWRDER